MYIALAFALQDLGPNYLMLIVVGSAVACTIVLYLAKKRKTAPRPVPVLQTAIPAAAAVAVTNSAGAQDTVAPKPKILRVNPEGMLQDK